MRSEHSLPYTGGDNEQRRLITLQIKPKKALTLEQLYERRLAELVELSSTLKELTEDEIRSRVQT